MILSSCNFVKLRFTYLIIDSKESYKFDYSLRLLNFDNTINVSIQDFLLSILTNIIAPFLFLQGENVNMVNCESYV